MANPVKVWETVINKWFGTQANRVTLAIGHAIVDKNDAAGRTYILVGPPATGKTTVLNLIRQMCEFDKDIMVGWEMDPNKIEEFRTENRLFDRPILFGESNKAPDEELKDVFVIETKGKSKPMSLEEYKKVVKIMTDGVMEIRKHCIYRYVTTDIAYRKMEGRP